MPAFVEIEVGGIQKFIASTGKLKEMIGGSEIIYHICQEEFYAGILASIGCQAEYSPGAAGWRILVQNNAGILSMILPDREKAAAFLTAFSGKVLAQFPGLPLFGAQADMAELAKPALDAARKLANERISMQRMTVGVANGAPMLPILRAAPLDGLPAARKVSTASGEDEFISLPSLCRRNPAMLEMSQKRLRRLVEAPEEVVWSNDLELMLGPNGGKVALIHMDGNDMGKLFGRWKNREDELAASIASMRKLSETIQTINNMAFAHAARGILEYIRYARREARPVMPLRPLVLGGDDITVIAAAEIALAFIQLFFTSYAGQAKARNLPLSLGIGMVVMDSSYPFVKAFTLVESLLESAKGKTLNIEPRPCTLDYLVITEEVEGSVADLRRRVYTADDGSLLTAKPFVLGPATLDNFINDGLDILSQLPRSALRPAFTVCRQGQKAAHAPWLNAKENLERRLGGRKGKLMTVKRFEQLFKDGFFQTENGETRTMLGDYLELERILPAGAEQRALLRDIMVRYNDATERQTCSRQ